MQLTISASSTALFSTWVFLEELGVLFDAGDGVAASLCQKARKIRHVFLSHADRDHVCGLLQLHQLNARNGVPQIYFPADCGSFPALRDFMARFDPQSGPATWTGLAPGSVVDVQKDYQVVTHPSSHIQVDGQAKALSFTLRHSRRSLKQKYKDLPGPQIAALRKELGNDAITEQKNDPLLGYSGDVPHLDPDLWADHKILIHECTFLEPDTAARPHSCLPQVINESAQLPLEALILLHFSARYSEPEIRAAISDHAQSAQPSFPIYVVPPGKVCFDILKEEPAWSPAL